MGVCAPSVHCVRQRRPGSRRGRTASCAHALRLRDRCAGGPAARTGQLTATGQAGAECRAGERLTDAPAYGLLRALWRPPLREREAEVLNGLHCTLARHINRLKR
ncbi:hypothetical protein NDU88_009487 [Pleurodeles waltl]|uniref:Uncharacterized protein n=1 Tax=Pleurodeles waltl TaxID=8319 RepID=A0AAV7PTE1_PLEWA|nr:hypothetical protein NDU88_009487 [Pleurodeles waltl]